MSNQPDRIDDDGDEFLGVTRKTGIANVTGYTGAIGSKEDDVQGHEMTSYTSYTSVTDEDEGKPGIAL